MAKRRAFAPPPRSADGHQGPIGISHRGACLLLLFVLVTVGAGSAAADEAAWQDKVQQAETLLDEAKQRHAAGDRARTIHLGTRAARLLEEAEKDKPGDPRTPLLAVHAFVYAGDRNRARQALAAYGQRTPRGGQDPDFLYGRALIAFYLEGRPDIAGRSLEQMIQGPTGAIPPTARDLYYLALMGEAAHWRDRADYEHAMPLLRKAVDIAEEMNDAQRARRAWSRAGVVLSFGQRYREAEVIYRRLVAEDRDNPLWHFNMGLILANQARQEEAIPAYERALALIEKHPAGVVMQTKFRQAWLKLGNCHRILAGRAVAPPEREAHLQAARVALMRYIDLAPQDARGPFWYGRLLYDELGLPYEALEQFQKAHELDPVCDAALGRMIQIAVRHGPKPTGTPAQDAKAKAAWSEQLGGWRSDFEQNQAERKRLRRLRKEQSPEKADGCS